MNTLNFPQGKYQREKRSRRSPRVTVRVVPANEYIGDGFEPVLEGKSGQVNAMIAKMMKKLDAKEDMNLEFSDEASLEEFKKQSKEI